MVEAISASAVKQALVEKWGQDAADTDGGETKIYIQFVDAVVASMMIDCTTGMVHCLADLPDRFPRSALPDAKADLCVYANDMNIMLADVLGLTQSLQVRDQTLRLANIGAFSGPQDVVETCQSLANESMALMQSVADILVDIGQGSSQSPAGAVALPV